ncbi:MAG: PEP-CTERM sorting domain-containing protein, partial [Deltaproteobacteria bacterium]
GGITEHFYGCTLRAAIVEANADPAHDVIVLDRCNLFGVDCEDNDPPPPPIFGAVLQRADANGGDEDSAQSGDLDILAPLTIVGEGIGVTAIASGAPAPGEPRVGRVFEIRGDVEVSFQALEILDGTVSGAERGGGIEISGAIVELEGVGVSRGFSEAGGGGIANADGGELTLRNSFLIRNTSDGAGGGIYNLGPDSIVTVQNSSVGFVLNQGTFGNTAQAGGGIANSEGSVVLENSVIEVNVAEPRLPTGTTGGGGVFNTGDVQLIASEVRNNDAPEGGGIESIGGSLRIAESTIHGNTSSSSRGGGIIVVATDGDPATLTVSNSTVSGNRALGQDLGGAGVALFGPDATADLEHVTLYETDAQNGVAGGGLELSLGATARIANTLIAGNGAGGVENDVSVDGASTLTSLGGNLIGTDRGLGGGFQPQATDRVGTAAQPIDPLLGALLDNGGPTRTHEPEPGSPAVDLAVTDTCLAVDQRGVLRPQGPRCDTGSVELVPEPARGVLLGSGLAVAAVLARCRRRSSQRTRTAPKPFTSRPHLV